MATTHAKAQAHFECRHHDALMIIGRAVAAFGSSGVISNTTGSTKNAVITKPAGTGLYTVTVPSASEVYPISAQLVQESGTDDRRIEIEEFTGNTIKLVHFSGANEADATDGDRVVVHFSMRAFSA